MKKYFLDCFECGRLKIEYDNYEEALKARNLHEKRFEHLANIELNPIKEGSNDSKKEM